MRAGTLRHLVTIQKPDPRSSRDIVGERITDWLDVASVSADVKPISGRSAFLAAQRQSSATHEIHMRWMPSLKTMDATWRVLFGDRIFIQDGSPENIDERDRQILLTCIEGLRQQ